MAQFQLDTKLLDLENFEFIIVTSTTYLHYNDIPLYVARYLFGNERIDGFRSAGLERLNVSQPFHGGFVLLSHKIGKGARFLPSRIYKPDSRSTVAKSLSYSKLN